MLPSHGYEFINFLNVQHMQQHNIVQKSPQVLSGTWRFPRSCSLSKKLGAITQVSGIRFESMSAIFLLCPTIKVRHLSNKKDDNDTAVETKNIMYYDDALAAFTTQICLN
jgi:hypothetical protein